MYRPIGTRITVRPLKAEVRVIGGIDVAEDSKKKQMRGEVLEVGSEVKKVSKGDVVIYSPFYHDVIEPDAVIICDEQDIWCVVG